MKSPSLAHASGYYEEQDKSGTYFGTVLKYNNTSKATTVAQFKFRLQSLLKYRENRRNQCRMLLASIMADDQKLIDQKTDLQQNRVETLVEMKQQGSGGNVNIDAMASRRFHSTQLTVSMMGIDQQRSLVAKQIEYCRLTLVQADQDVKVLEKLKEKQQIEFQHQQDKKADLAREEAWSVINR